MSPNKHSAANETNRFEGFHLYHTFEVDGSLRDDPVVFYKREMFLQMYAADRQSKDTRLVLLATGAVMAAPLFLGLPSLERETFHQFLSAAFQGFCGLLGLLAVAVTYYLQLLKEHADAAVSEFRSYLISVGCSVSTSQPLEMCTEAENELAARAAKKRTTVDQQLLSHLHARTNYCTRLLNAPSSLRLQIFMLLPPSLMLLVFSLAGLALDSLGPSVQFHFEWSVLGACVLLSSIVFLRCFRISRQYFWVKLDSSELPEGMVDLPPDTFPKGNRRNARAKSDRGGSRNGK